MHYLIQPTWWSDQWKENPSFLIDPQVIDAEMEKVVQYYKDMSWGKMIISYEILPQSKLSVASDEPRLYQAKNACEDLISDQGYQEGVDYDGIIFIYQFSKKGEFITSGATGQTNNNFIWVSADNAISHHVLRHEIGHNLGHEHHARSSYLYRTTRPNLPSVFDGFDMVSSQASLLLLLVYIQISEPENHDYL